MRERFAGRYVLLKPLGSGGMGDVFLALDLTTGAECALKRLARRTPLATPELMRREFDALTRVRHPAIIAVYELGFDFDGTPYYTMEYVPGLPADRAIARGDWVALPFVAAEVARGLEALHAAGVTHGDLKPSNLLVVPGPGPGALPAAVRLVDFGLAALRDERAGGHRGTPGFAAPEVVRGERPGAASDLYGLGSTLYALVAGRPPYEGEHPSSMLRRQQQGPPPARPLEESGAPTALVRLILRLLAPSPLERPADAREARRELERLHPAARRPLADRMRGVVTAGRERELAWLDTRNEADGARLVILVGEAGMGKSTLLGELAARAALAGRGVAWLVCSGADGAGASALRIARRLAAEAGIDADADGSLTPAARVALAGETPELPEAELSALVESVAAWSLAAARRRGVPLLLVDDSERMDPLSRAFARRIIVHPAAAPMTWVWARRPDAAGGPEDERLLLEAGLAETLRLEPLDAGGLERLAAARLGEPVPGALLEFLVRGTGGHPGLAVEMLRAAADAGALRETETGLLLVAERLEGLATPPSFEASLLERFEAAPSSARAVALALAVMGRPLGAERLRAIEPRADAAAAEALVAAGLAFRDEGGALGLMPPALAGALLERLEPGARDALHRAALASGPLAEAERFGHLARLGEIGAALEAAEAAFVSRPDARLAAAAAALAEAERPATAATWHERAARALSARGRYAAARPHLERALALDPSPAARPGRWVMLSTACLRVGRPEDAARVAAAALAEPLPAAARSLVLGNEASRLLGLGMRDEALPRAREALALAGSTGDDAAIGATAMTLSAALLECGAGAEAAAMAERAVEAFARVRDVTRELRALGACASIAHARREPAEGERLHREAIARARAHDARLPLEEMLLNSAVALGEAGRWAESRQAAAESLRLALEDGRPRGAALALANLAQTDGLMGDASNALREARAALKLCRVHAPQLLDFAWRSLSQALRNAGRLRLAERYAQRALARRMRGSGDEGGDWCRIELGRVRAARGDWARAGALWERPLAEARPIGSLDRAVLAALAGRAALRRGAFEVAAARLEAVDAWLAGHAAPYAAAIAELLRAELALAQGRAAEGIAGAGRALERLERLPAPAERAQAALELSRLALAAEGEVRAPLGAWLDLAAGIFERLGDHRGREATLALTVDWLRRAGTRVPAAGRERNLIESVSRLINSMSDFHELTRRAMQAAVEQLDAERGVLLLADAESGRLSPVAEHGAVDATTRRDAVGYSRRVVERVAESGGSLLIGDAPADPEARSQSVVDLRLRSIVCVPLYLGGRVVGAVYLDDSRRPDVFSDADRALLEGFAHLMAVAIENSRGHQEVLRANELLVGENLSLRKEVSARFRAESLIATSSAMLRVLAIVERAARVRATVLLTGENGTGKELVARILHHGGKRRLKPFVAVNCGAIPESLLETELFGILPQVATDVRARDGRFVQADGGTLFLDEIGEMPLKQQVALLSAIASREITPVGGGKPIPVDVRIIAASNRDLRQLVERGAFREDLFYRLNVIPIEIPPLRERKADIPALAQHFVALHARQQEREVPSLSREFLAVLMQSDWPGNVRELQNYVERVLAMTPGDTLYPTPPPRDLEERASRVKLGQGGTLASMVEGLERRAIEEALDRAAGNQSLAARQMGMTEQSLRYRIRKYGLASYRQIRRTRRNRM
jgi:Nif-specific regulatory protein